MKKLNKAELEKILEENNNSNFTRKVNDIIKKNPRTNFYEFTIQNIETISSFVFKALDHTRFLTPHGKRRTVKDVLERIVNEFEGFEKLHKKHPTDQCERFLKIMNFDYDKVGHLLIRTANKHENMPESSFYLHDGSHRAIMMLYMNKYSYLDFKPVKALFFDQ